MAFVLDVNLAIKRITGLGQLEAKLAAVGKAASIGLSKGFGSFNKQLKRTERLAVKTASSLGKAAKAQADFSKASTSAAKSTAGATTALKAGAKGAQNFGDKILLAGTRYASFVVATAVPLAIIGSLGAATSAAVAFEKQMLKINQVLSPTTERFAEIRSVILALSQETGVAAEEIGKAAQILAQAGALTADVDLRGALEDLAKVPLLPTFEGIEQATDGILAFTKQFGLSISDTGAILEKLNAVSKKFAVESKDLIEAAKRGGAAFSAFGGDIDDFIGIVAALRQTTRESATSIGTALKTISTRVIREENIRLLETFNIKVRDSNGVLLKAIEILRNLSQGFDQLGKEQKRQLAESLGGFRQVGKIIAALSGQFKLVDEASKVSRESINTLARDAEKALQIVSGQFGLLKAQLFAFVQALAPGVILPIVSNLIAVGRAATSIAQALSPAIALAAQLGTALALIAAIKFGPSLLGVLGSVGGKIGGFLTGGGAAAGAAAAGGAAAAAGGLGPIAQFAILAGVIAAIGKVTDSFEIFDGSLGRIVNNFAILGSSVIALIAVLLKQTIAATLLTPTGGVIIGVTAIAVTLSEIASDSANRIGDAIFDASERFGDRVKAIPLEKSVDAIGDLAFVINTSLQEVAEVAEKEFSGFGGALGAGRLRVTKAIDKFVNGNIIEGLEDLFSNATLGVDEAKRILTKQIGGSADLFATVIQQAFEESGVNFKKDLAKRLSGGDVTKEAVFTEVINDLIKKFGGINSILSSTTVSLQSFETKFKALKNTLPAELFNTALLTNVNSFTTALSKATEVIGRSNQRFEQTLNQDPLKIQVRRRRDITNEEVKGRIREGGGLEKLGIEVPDVLSSLSSEFQNTFRAFEKLTEFAAVLSGALAKSSDKSEDFVKRVTTNFSKGLDFSDKRLTLLLPQIGELVRQAVEQGQLLDPKIIENAINTVFKLNPLAPAFIQGITNILNATQKGVELAVQADLQDIKIDLKHTELQDFPNLLRTLFDEAGIALKLSSGGFIVGLQKISESGFGFTQITDSLVDANKAGLAQLAKVADNAPALVTAVLEDYRKELFASVDAQKKLDEGLRLVTGSFKVLSDAANAADLEVNKTRAAMQALTIGLEKSKQAIASRAAAEREAIGQNDQKLAQSRRDEAEQIAQIDSQISKIAGTAARIQVAAARRGAGENVFEIANDVFQQSVKDFAAAVSLLLKASTADTPTGTAGAGPVSLQPTTTDVIQTAFGTSLKELITVFNTEKERLRGSPAVGALGVVGGGGGFAETEIVAAAIKNIAKQIALATGEIDVTKLESQIRLAVSGGFNAANLAGFLKDAFTKQQEELFTSSQERLQQQQAPAQAPSEQLSQNIQDLATTVNTQLNKLTDVVGKVGELFTGDNKSREDIEITTEELEEAIGTLGNNTEANTEALEKSTSDQREQSVALGTSLSEATVAMVELKGGVSVQLEAMQDLNVKISLDESLTKFEPQIKSIMGQIADDHIRQALTALASNSTDQDRQKEVNDTLEGLA